MFVATHNLETSTFRWSSNNIGVNIMFKNYIFTSVLKSSNSIFGIFQIQKWDLMLINVKWDDHLFQERSQGSKHRHHENRLIFLKLKYHFIEKTQNFKLIHILNVEINLLKVLFIKYKLVIIHAKDVLRWKHYFRKGCF
jgi:hypothetical protein